jgi:DNA-binding transcriptional ArsR family regulator
MQKGGHALAIEIPVRAVGDRNVRRPSNIQFSRKSIDIFRNVNFNDYLNDPSYMVPPLADSSQIAARFKALGDPVRLRMLKILPESPNCEHRNNVSQLSELLGMSQPTVSHHLKILKSCGLVQSKKMCRDVFYWRDAAAAAETLELVRESLRAG